MNVGLLCGVEVVKGGKKVVIFNEDIYSNMSNSSGPGQHR